jgi:ribosomal protein S18 acetylase RimI-like enzyme
MRRLDTLTGGPDRLRIGSWRGDPSVALLSPTPGRSPTASGLDRALGELARRGYRAVLTPALTQPEQAPFAAAGFTVHERLHLLRHPLDSVPEPRADGARLRRGRTRDVPHVLEVDGLAFDRFWRFDAPGLADARTATPSARFRVATLDGRVVGYHVTGRAGALGYLQRLAVHPARHGRGIGTALVGDALDWCRRRGATSVLVNTQETNRRALRLYEQLGFRPEPTGLAVLRRPLDEGPPG